MLAYLNALCNALLGRDLVAIELLLRHPLATALPESVVTESKTFMESAVPAHVAPVAALKLYHQTAHLLGLGADIATHALVAHDALPPLGDRGPKQMEFPLANNVA